MAGLDPGIWPSSDVSKWDGRVKPGH